MVESKKEGVWTLLEWHDFGQSLVGGAESVKALGLVGKI